jgi:hypothetical protein
MNSEPPGRLMTMGRNGFERRLVRLEPESELLYRESEWTDELVIVVCGTLELEGRSGRRWTFRKGSIIWLQELPLRAIHNPTGATTILMAVSRPISCRPQTRRT